MQLPVTLSVRPSFFLAAVLFCGHGVAILSLYPLEAPLPAKAVLAAALFASAFASIRRILLRGSGTVVAVTLQRGEKCLLHYRNGGGEEVRPLGGSFVHAWLVVLNFRDGKGRLRHLALPRGALYGADHRQLRLWLRSLPTG